jgi:hypothetical protein
MIRHASADILSPRELGRQVRTYLILSALFWVVLSFIELVSLLDLRLFSGHSLSPIRDGATFLTFSLATVGLLLTSAVTGTLAALPAVACVLVANSGSAFNQHFESPTKRMRRKIINLSLPAICCVTHLLILLASMGTAPNYFRQVGSADGLLATMSRQVYEILFSELQFDHSRQWRLAFSERKKESETLVVLLPASILNMNGGFPLVERLTGAPVPFLLDSQFPASQMAELPIPSERIFNHNFKTPSTLRLTTDEIILARLALSQPQLFLLLRFGLGEQFSQVLRWENLIVDDATSLARFLTYKVSTDGSAPVSALALTEMDVWGDALPSLAVRLPRGTTESELRQRAHDLDLLLTRGLHALRQNEALDLLVLPYSDSGPGFPFSRAYIRPGKDSPLARLIPPPGTHLTMQEVGAALRATSSANAGNQRREIVLADGGRCWELTLPPGFATERTAELRAKMAAEILPRLVSDSTFAIDGTQVAKPVLDLFSQEGLFCRTPSLPEAPAPQEYLFLWNRDELPPLDAKSAKKPASLARVLLHLAEIDSETPIAPKTPPRRPTRKRIAPKTSPENPVPEEHIDIEHRLAIYAVAHTQAGRTGFTPLAPAKEAELLQRYIDALKGFFLQEAQALQ